jgi:hypothetical protein
VARYRLLDTASSDLGTAELDPDDVVEDAPVRLPDGTSAIVLEIYDDIEGNDDDPEVIAALVLDID